MGNINAPIQQVASGYITAVPHPFPVHLHAGGVDQSNSVIKRLFSFFRNFTPYINTVNNQPTAGAKTNAYMAHNIAATTFIGQNAVARGFDPNPYQPGMMYMPQEAFPITGLGGLVNGEMLGQDLLGQDQVDAFEVPT